MLSVEHRRIWTRILNAYHDSVVYVKGVERRDRNGKPICPLGLKEAAKIAGLNPSDMSNRLNINMPEHRPTLEGFVLHLLEGMDMATLDEIERANGRVAIRMPDIEGHDDLQNELATAMREFGDVGSAFADALDERSVGGKGITRREVLKIHKEIDEAVGALYELLAAAEEMAK